MRQFVFHFERIASQCVNTRLVQLLSFFLTVLKKGRFSIRRVSFFGDVFSIFPGTDSRLTSNYFLACTNALLPTLYKYLAADICIIKCIVFNIEPYL